MKQFKMTRDWSAGFTKPEFFGEDDAPKWLCEGGLVGTTMDMRWFWNEHVLTLKVGQNV